MRIEVFQFNKTHLFYDKEKNIWYAINTEDGKEYNLTMEKNLVSILKLLYVDPSLFYLKLKHIQSVEGLNDKLLDSLPINKLIQLCIDNDLYFWLELSLKWVSYIKIDSDLYISFIAALDNKKIPQKIRHQLKKIIA